MLPYAQPGEKPSVGARPAGNAFLHARDRSDSRRRAPSSKGGTVMAERNCTPVGTHAWTRGANRRGRVARTAVFALAGLGALAAAAAGGTAAVVSCDTS